jgi:hypothetical protein
MKTPKTPPASIVVTKKAKKALPPKPGTKEGDAKPAAKTLDKAMEQLKDLKLARKKAPKGPSSQASRAEDMEFLNKEIAKNEASLKEVAAKENEETLKQATLGVARDEIKKVQARQEAEPLEAESPKATKSAKREAKTLQLAASDALKAKKAKATHTDDASSTVHSYGSNGRKRLVSDQDPRRLRSNRGGHGGDGGDDDDDDEDSHLTGPDRGGGGGGGRGGGGGAGGGGGGDGDDDDGGSEESYPHSRGSRTVITLSDLDPQNGKPTAFQKFLMDRLKTTYADSLIFTKHVCDSPTSLAKFTAHELGSALKTVQRMKESFPSGTPYPLRTLLSPTFSATSVRYLKALWFWAVVEEAVGQAPDYTNLDDATVERFASEAARQADPTLTVKVPPAPKLSTLEGFKLFEENLLAHLAAMTSACPSHAPLDYLLRPSAKPSQDDIDDTTIALPTYLRLCQLIVMRRSTPEYVKTGFTLDLERLYGIVRVATSGTVFAHFVTRHKDLKDGRSAFFDIKEHCQGKESQQHLVNVAKKTRVNLKYDGRPGYPFESYVAAYSTTQTMLEDQGEPVYPRAQVTEFLDGIKCAALATTVQLVRADRSLQENFLGATNAVNSEILRLRLENGHSRRNVGSLTQGRGGRGRGGRGRGRGGGRGDRGRGGRGQGRGKGKGKPHPDEKKGELRFNADGTIFTGTYFWWNELGEKKKQVEAARAAKKRSVSATRSDPEDVTEPQPKKAKTVAQEATVVDSDVSTPMDVVATVADDEEPPARKRKPVGKNAGQLMGRGARKSTPP